MGKTIDALYHTGIVVFGQEFWFGGGISSGSPGRTHFGVPLEVIELGMTEVPQEIFFEWLRGVGTNNFSSTSYDLMRNNCNTFTDQAAHFLVGKGIPEKISRMCDEIMASPLGAMISPMLENMSQAQQQSLGGHSEQPVPWTALNTPTTSMQTTPAPTHTPNSNPWAHPVHQTPSDIPSEEEQERTRALFAEPLRMISQNDASIRADLKRRLNKLAQNLLEHGDNPTFQRLRLSNKVVQKRLLEPIGGREWLGALGFKEASGDSSMVTELSSSEPQKPAEFLSIAGDIDESALRMSISLLDEL